MENESSADIQLTGRPAVLFVDDEAQLRALALEILEESGFEAIAASNGVEALAQLHARPDVKAVITDIQMPQMGGLLLAAMAQARNPSLKVGLITGFSEEAFKLLEMYNWPVLLKPFDLERLPKLARDLCLRGGDDHARS
jgi:DNA-binding NtrC family response regulator